MTSILPLSTGKLHSIAIDQTASLDLHNSTAIAGTSQVRLPNNTYDIVY